MALNTNLDPLISTIYQALYEVDNKNVGMINAVARDTNPDQIAVGQPIAVPVAPAPSVRDLDGIATQATPTIEGEAALDSITMTLTENKMASILWSGEQAKSLGSNYDAVLSQQFELAFESLDNLIEEHLISTALADATGDTIGDGSTDLFLEATGRKDFADIAKAFRDAGLSTKDKRLVLTSQHLANIQGEMSTLWNANEAGSDALLREGIVGRVLGQSVADSAGFGTAVDSLALVPSAVQFLNRPPATGQDMALDRTYVTSGKTGIVYEVSLYPIYRARKIEIVACYGSKVVRPEHVFTLAGV